MCLDLKRYLKDKMDTLGLYAPDTFIVDWHTPFTSLLKKFKPEEIKECLDWVFNRDDKYKPNPPCNPWEITNIMNKYRIHKMRQAEPVKEVSTEPPVRGSDTQWLDQWKDTINNIDVQPRMTREDIDKLRKKALGDGI